MLLVWKCSRVVLLICSLLIVVDCDGDSDQPSWQSFKSQFGKKYLNAALDSSKKQAYLSNLAKIAQFNAESHDFKLGVNQFTDETLDELKLKRRGLMKANQHKVVSDPIEEASIKNGVKSVGASSYPTSLSYQNTGYVSAVKDQGSCGSCWAFSSSAAVEAQTYRLMGKILSPSQQQLVDCSDTGYWPNSGCDGGLEINAYIYMSSGMMNEKAYPYTEKDGSCQAVSSKYVVATKSASFSSGGSKINGVYTDTSRTVANYYAFYEIVDDGTGDQSASFASAVINVLNQVGPIAVQVCATSDAFNLYSSGIYYNSACIDDDLDHSILLIGYNISSDNATQRYWIAKNQWGTTWGLNGYIYMRYGAGLIRNPTYPNIDTSFVSGSNQLVTSSWTLIAILFIFNRCLI